MDTPTNRAGSNKEPNLAELLETKGEEDLTKQAANYEKNKADRKYLLRIQQKIAINKLTSVYYRRRR